MHHREGAGDGSKCDATVVYRRSNPDFRGGAGFKKQRFAGILQQNASRLEQKVSELFELLRDPIYRYVCRLIGKRAEAEDLTQETFLRLYDSLQKGHAMGNVRPWLYRVAHNLAIDWLKQQGRLEQIEDDALPFAAAMDAAPNAEQRLLANERHERLRVALSQLSPQQRHCLSLRAEGLGYREIGEVLGIGVSTVATFLGRAIKRITLEQIFRANRFDPRRPLSAAAFAEWRQAIRTKAETVDANGDELKLTTVAASPYAVNAIAEAALIVRKRDWRAVALQLRVQAENELRDYELSETAYEVLPLNDGLAIAINTDDNGHSPEQNIGSLLACARAK